jgi:hypothetical protein
MRELWSCKSSERLVLDDRSEERSGTKLNAAVRL